MMAADMVRPGSAVADIGTDHAFLPSFLVLQGISPFAVASDVRRGPLKNARKTVEKYALEDKIKLVLSDGLDNIDESSVDDIILCGMGGTLAAQILKRADWLKNTGKRIIVQAQSHSEDVRMFLIGNGFKILYESACEDSGKLYCALCARWTGERVEYPPEFCYIGLLPDCKAPEAKRIIQKTLKLLNTRLTAFKKAGIEPGLVEELTEITVAIQKTLSEGKNADS